MERMSLSERSSAKKVFKAVTNRAENLIALKISDWKEVICKGCTEVI